jgi:hypothetical protein
MFRCVRSACDISRILADGLSVISDLFHRVLFKELPHYVVCRDIHGGPTQDLVVSGKSKVGAPFKYPRIHQPSVPTSSLQSEKGEGVGIVP